MDRFDRKILAQLQKDADITNVELAERVGLTPSTCLRRVAALKDKGVIRRTVAVVDRERLGCTLSAIVTVYVANHSREAFERLFDKARGEPLVSSVWATAGEADIVMLLHLHDMGEFRRLVDEFFNADPDVAKFTTQFIVETVKEDGALPLPG